VAPGNAYGGQVCFYAMGGADLVGGVPWTFDYDNCVDTSGVNTTVTGHALGLSATSRSS
jgi:hypothetical protein